MAITRQKFEAFFEINKIKSGKLGDREVIEIALAEYDVNLTVKDLKEMREDYERFMYKYIN